MRENWREEKQRRQSKSRCNESPGSFAVGTMGVAVGSGLGSDPEEPLDLGDFPFCFYVHFMHLIFTSFLSFSFCHLKNRDGNAYICRDFVRIRSNPVTEQAQSVLSKHRVSGSKVDTQEKEAADVFSHIMRNKRKFQW